MEAKEWRKEENYGWERDRDETGKIKEERIENIEETEGSRVVSIEIDTSKIVY